MDTPLQSPAALRHVASAIHHAEALADEAEDASKASMSAHLRTRATELDALLEETLRCIEAVSPLRDARERAHAALGSVYQSVTLRLAELLHPDDTSVLTPGGHLDVAERARFRLRRLPMRAELAEVKETLRQAIGSYEHVVDNYLHAAALAQGKKDRVVIESQALRLELERAKAALLTVVDAGGDAWRRIKRRTVRTKRARWLDEARAQRLLGEAVAA